MAKLTQERIYSDVAVYHLQAEMQDLWMVASRPVLRDDLGGKPGEPEPRQYDRCFILPGCFWAGSSIPEETTSHIIGDLTRIVLDELQLHWHLAQRQGIVVSNDCEAADANGSGVRRRAECPHATRVSIPDVMGGGCRTLCCCGQPLGNLSWSLPRFDVQSVDGETVSLRVRFQYEVHFPDRPQFELM